MKPLNPVLARFGTTIFTVMSALAAECGAINLGQGFPDEEGPQALRRCAADAILDGSNQYPPMRGIADLRRAVAEHDRRFYGLELDWQSEVLITSGATEALADSFFGLIEPGDETVVVEPLYDSYLPIIEQAGGIVRLVRLEPPEWALPREALAAAFGPRTKLLVLNSPLNPAGKVFERDELAFIAGLIAAHDAYAVCDEVYEHLIFDGGAHVPLITLAGMRERCLRVGSAGKTFSATGWKVGYVVGAPALIDAAARAHQFITFTTPPNLQTAVAAGLRLDDGYFHALSRDQQGKRDRLAAGLAAAGFDVLASAGSYFLIADFRRLGFSGDDVAFCRYLTREAGVAAIPVSAFYRDAESSKAGAHSEIPHGFVRFCFCKSDEVLNEAIDRLTRHFSRGRAVAIG
ncbi:MAG: aminotransferase [Rhodospirillales bacterium]|nr:aminotransferase [Rhodospirillales bacterium]